MNEKLPNCAQCDQPFWPAAGQRTPFCPNCVGIENGAAEQPERPLQAKTQLPLPVTGNAVSVRPRELPGIPLPGKAPEETIFEKVRGKQAPQVMFTCPSCMTMLALKANFAYSGNALPCPYCAAAIVPPQFFVPKGVGEKGSNVWKIGEQKDRNKIYRPPRDRANVTFVKEKA